MIRRAQSSIWAPVQWPTAFIVHAKHFVALRSSPQKAHSSCAYRAAFNASIGCTLCSSARARRSSRDENIDYFHRHVFMIISTLPLNISSFCIILVLDMLFVQARWIPFMEQWGCQFLDRRTFGCTVLSTCELLRLSYFRLSLHYRRKARVWTGSVHLRDMPLSECSAFLYSLAAHMMSPHCLARNISLGRQDTLWTTYGWLLRNYLLAT